MSCKVDSVGFCSCPLAYLSSKWRLMYAKLRILYERIFKMQRFSKSGDPFFGWKKTTTTLYVYFNLTVGAGREGIHCLLCSEMNWQKTPAKTVPNSLLLHKHTKKIRASTVQVQFFLQLKSILGLSSIFLLPNVLRTWYVSGPEINLFGMHFCLTNTPTCFFFAWAWRHWNQP